MTNAQQQLRDLYMRAQQRSAAMAAGKRQARQQLQAAGAKRVALAQPAAQGGSAGALAAALDAVLNADAAAGGSGGRNGHGAAAGNARAAAVVLPRQPFAVDGATLGSPAVRAQPAVTAAAAAGAGGVAGGINAAGVAAALPVIEIGRAKGSAMAVADAAASAQLPGVDQLRAMTARDLVALLRARRCPVSGSKDELVRRLLSYQQRVRRAAQGSGPLRM